MLQPADSARGSPQYGAYRIINIASGKVLDAELGHVSENGCCVQLWDWNGASNQRFRLAD